MDDSMTIANNLVAMIETYYNDEFLVETYLPNKPVVKTGFYAAMLEAINEEPLEDAEAQKLVVDKLTVIYKNALELVADELTEIFTR